MSNYPKFSQSKFYYKGEVTIRDHSWPIQEEERYITKKVFAMTKTYKKYLEEKAKFDMEEELRILKQKLEWQQKHLGEIDEIDFQYYQYKLREYLAR